MNRFRIRTNDEKVKNVGCQFYRSTDLSTEKIKPSTKQSLNDSIRMKDRVFLNLFVVIVPLTFWSICFGTVWAQVNMLTYISICMNFLRDPAGVL
ncbi:hypothetical protein EG68_02215 [Paragonimus skrjabini miyazakii]|uniref:Uncharacterized protein n=1 Tax=Paragonimus skrjabini miyazakii TaxID=59628 RepID=A0A8S9Z9Q4_9TREM|nr:hypothetical protein EG68_02215 [Paragonimus skrjabini miyazakii]